MVAVGVVFGGRAEADLISATRRRLWREPVMAPKEAAMLSCSESETE